MRVGQQLENDFCQQYAQTMSLMMLRVLNNREHDLVSSFGNDTLPVVIRAEQQLGHDLFQLYGRSSSVVCHES